MRIFIFSSSPEPVGVAKNTLALCKSLSGRGYDVSMLTLNSGWLTKECQLLGVPVKAFKFSSVFWSAILINFYLFFLLRNERGACLHLNGRATIFSSILCLAFNRNVKYFYSIRQFVCVGHPGFLSWKVKLEKFLMGLSKISLHAVSKPLADETQLRILNKKNVVHIPNFLPIRSEGSVDECFDYEGKRKFRFIFAGRLSLEKGADILIDAFANAHQNIAKVGFNLGLDVYGSGEQCGYLAGLIKHYSLQDYVTLRGQCDCASELFSNYDAVIIPSRSESFGLVAIEAFAKGVPVIASDIPGLASVVGDSALLYAAENPSELALAINKFCDSFSLRKTLRDRGVARAKRFSENMIVPKFELLYKGIFHSD